jgi:hypothetical protein
MHISVYFNNNLCMTYEYNVKNNELCVNLKVNYFCNAYIHTSYCLVKGRIKKNKIEESQCLIRMWLFIWEQRVCRFWFDLSRQLDATCWMHERDAQKRATSETIIIFYILFYYIVFFLDTNKIWL